MTTTHTFLLGTTVATPGALQALREAGESPLGYLARHTACDWGDLDTADKRDNDLSVRVGFRVLSAYRLRTGVKVWVITEADRSSTCILLPEEY